MTSFVLDQYRLTLTTFFSLEFVWMNSAAVDRMLDQNKLLGATIAAQVGLRVIPTVLTDSAEAWTQAVTRFSASGDVAVKPAAMWAARVDDDSGDVLSLFTQRLTRAAALGLTEQATRAPVIVQPYVDKLYELRVTVVGEQIFACRIDSQQSERTATDWRRYDFERTPHEPIQLAPALTSAIRQFMEAAGLKYAALDFIVDVEGFTHFVEANPAGQFGWIEELTDLPISDAIVDWLLGIRD